MKLFRALVLTLPALAMGCAHQNWVAGPNAQGTFSEAKGRCMLLANNTGGGFYAQGSQQFVASAAAGAAIGNAIKAASNFDACMMANGWEIADEPRASVAASYPPPAPYAAPASKLQSAAPPSQTIEPPSPAPVMATVNPGPADPIPSTPPKVTQSTIANSGPPQMTHPKPSSANVAASSEHAGEHNRLSATATALSAAPARPLPVRASPAVIPAATAATVIPAGCTHEQQVQARIAKMNGYTGGPKCD